jgi:hypothetical protein
MPIAEAIVAPTCTLLLGALAILTCVPPFPLGVLVIPVDICVPVSVAAILSPILTPIFVAGFVAMAPSFSKRPH